MLGTQRRWVCRQCCMYTRLIKECVDSRGGTEGSGRERIGSKGCWRMDVGYIIYFIIMKLLDIFIFELNFNFTLQIDVAFSLRCKFSKKTKN